VRGNARAELEGEGERVCQLRHFVPFQCRRKRIEFGHVSAAATQQLPRTAVGGCDRGGDNGTLRPENGSRRLPFTRSVPQADFWSGRATHSKQQTL
jgi:hypothetical protein